MIISRLETTAVKSSFAVLSFNNGKHFWRCSIIQLDSFRHPLDFGKIFVLTTCLLLHFLQQKHNWMLHSYDFNFLLAQVNRCILSWQWTLSECCICAISYSSFSKKPKPNNLWIPKKKKHRSQEYKNEMNGIFFIRVNWNHRKTRKKRHKMGIFFPF